MPRLMIRIHGTMVRGSRALALGVGLLLAAPGWAQEVVDGRTVYQPAFFVPFAPATALDMVNRTPGFRLEDIDTDVRGFGQAAGNVVINGQRPSAKSDSLSTQLARIPATRVLRVEVASGDRFGAEFAGRPQVLNLVLKADGGLSGTVDAKVRRAFTGEVRPEGGASAVLKRGTSSFSAGLQVSNSQTSEEGSDTITSLPDGALVEYRSKLNRIADPYAILTLGWAQEEGAGRSAHLNARVLEGRFALTQTNRVTPAVLPPRDDRLTQRFNTHEWELGGDISRPLGSGTLKLIGLLNRRDRDNREVSRLGVGSGAETGFAQRVDDRQEESLARLVWSRSQAAGWSVEMGGEGVVNRLVSDVDLAAVAGGVATPIDLPIGNAVVKEIRGELFLNGGRQLSPAVRLELGLTGELSRLTVSGDATAARTLKFLKPKLSLDARKGPWKLQGSLLRTVNQLQFGDFISVAELTNERVNGGNAELQPQRAWELLGTAEKTILGDGLIRFELGYTLVQKVQDRVPTPEGFDAPGNLGSGREIIARMNLDAPLARFGVKGGRFSTRVSLVDTAVEDPYTGDQRPFSGTARLLVDLVFRQDLGSFAWGVSGYANTGSTTYRRNEEDRNFRPDIYWTAFAELRPDSRTVVTFSVDNLSDIQARRERTFFTPDRTADAPFLRELRQRNQHIIPALAVKRSFG